MNVQNLTARINQLEEWKLAGYLSETERALNQKVADLQLALAVVLCDQLKNRTGEPLTQEEENNVRGRQVISAIKSVRERLNMSLLEAKNYVYDWAASRGLGYYTNAYQKSGWTWY